MHVAVSGATGAIGHRIVGALIARGDSVTALSRSPERAQASLAVAAAGWDPVAGAPPAQALRDADVVIHLAGESVSQRWNDEVKQRIHASRELGTRNLVKAIAALPAEQRPHTLVSASATGYYGDRGDETLTEASTPGEDFLAGVCIAWEREAAAVTEHGVRHCSLRNGLVLDTGSGALERMLPVFRLGAGGPVAGGRQYMPWIHIDDIVSIYLRAADDDAWSGVFNASGPEPVTNREFSRTLGKALHRPAFAPVPGFAVRTIFGEMAELVTCSQRAVPERALTSGWQPEYATATDALNALLA